MMPQGVSGDTQDFAMHRLGTIGEGAVRFLLPKSYVTSKVNDVPKPMGMHALAPIS